MKQAQRPRLHVPIAAFRRLRFWNLILKATCLKPGADRITFRAGQLRELRDLAPVLSMPLWWTGRAMCGWEETLGTTVFRNLPTMGSSCGTLAIGIPKNRRDKAPAQCPKI